MLGKLLSKKMEATPDPAFLASLKDHSLIGYGSYGVVAKRVYPSAYNPKNMKQTATKFLFLSDTLKVKDHEGILQEFHKVASLSHPNLVNIQHLAGKQFTATEVAQLMKRFSSEDQSSKLWYVVEAKNAKRIAGITIMMDVHGENLRQWLNQAPERVDRRVEFTQVQICLDVSNGLKYLHEQKILHGNLKPENILFSEPGFKVPLKLGDFGFPALPPIRPSKSQTKSYTINLDYMAPGSSSRTYTPQDDLFSLGLIIWETAQLLKFVERKNFFDKLVNGRDANLINGNKVMPKVKELVVGLVNKSMTFEQALLIVRHWQVAQNTDEFQYCLDHVSAGGVIQLVDVVYEGNFRLEKDNVMIFGLGGRGKPVIKGQIGRSDACLEVASDACSIAGIKIIGNEETTGIFLKGSRNTVQDVELSGGSSYGVRSQGDENKLENMSISDYSNIGIQISGGKNVVNKIKLENITSHGIYVYSDNSTVSNVTCSDVKNGIEVLGSNNKLFNIKLDKNSGKEGFSGVKLYKHSHDTTIENLTCTGYLREKDDWALEIESLNTTVSNSRCGPILLKRRDVTLTNVDGGELIQVDEDVVNVKLINSRGEKLVSKTEVKTTDCKFREVQEMK